MKRLLLLLLVVVCLLGKVALEILSISIPHPSELPWGKRFQQKAIQGVLGGFRGVIADLSWLNVTLDWESRQWVRLQENIWVSTRIQPESLLFWDVGAWHLAWNAALGEKNDVMELSSERRRQKEEFWVEQGRLLLEEGILYHPTSFKLWLQLGWLHQQRRHDYQSAYDCFLKASTLPGAPSYVARLAGYALEKQGKMPEAIEFWHHLLETSTRPADRDMIEKRLLKLEKDSTLPPLKSLP
ncbi:MAG: hypothetical protein V4507_09860 [Verrucomicrobiota bacterium]